MAAPKAEQNAEEHIEFMDDKWRAVHTEQSWWDRTSAFINRPCYRPSVTYGCGGMLGASLTAYVLLGRSARFNYFVGVAGFAVFSIGKAVHCNEQFAKHRLQELKQQQNLPVPKPPPKQS